MFGYDKKVAQTMLMFNKIRGNFVTHMANYPQEKVNSKEEKFNVYRKVPTQFKKSLYS